MDFTFDTIINAILFGLLGLLILIYLWLRRHFSYWERKGVLHVKADSYVFGNIKDVLFKKTSLVTKYDEIYKKFIDEPYCGLYEFHNPVLMINDPDLIQTVVVEKFSSFQQARMAVNKNADELWYHNPFVLSGARWKEVRAIIASGLTQNKLRVIEEMAKPSVQDMFDYIDNNSNDIDTYKMCASFSIDVITKFGWGIECNGFSENSTVRGMFEQPLMTASFFQFNLMYLNPVLNRLFNLRLYSKEGTNILKSITNQVIENKSQTTLVHTIEKTREKYRPNEKDTALMEITSYMASFFVDGYDMVSRILSLTIYSLMLHPDVQKKLKDEVKGVENITIEEVSKLKYLDMVISEVNRFYPILTAIPRVCNEDFKLGDLEIEAGTFISIPIAGIHHNPKYYPDPYEFNPEHFSEENKQKRHKYTHFPFGAGPRSCPGQRYAMAIMKIFLCYLLKRYYIVPPKSHTPKPVVTRLGSTLMLIPQDDIYVQFKRTL